MVLDNFAASFPSSFLHPERGSGKETVCLSGFSLKKKGKKKKRDRLP
jgi:hypothetical protein